MKITDLTGSPVSISEAVNLGNKIITVVSTIGSVLSVIVLIVIGIKYMLGSVEEKAEYKKTLIPYVVGCIIVFAASSIAQLIFNILTAV